MIMGRGRGKGKRFPISNHEDGGSGEEEKIPIQKRRGRPPKPLKNAIEEEESDEIEVEGNESMKDTTPSNEIKKPLENGKKRKRRFSQAKDKSDLVKLENGFGNRYEATRTNGFRHTGSRRKSKPRRAAEAGVVCN